MRPAIRRREQRDEALASATPQLEDRATQRFGERDAAARGARRGDRASGPCASTSATGRVSRAPMRPCRERDSEREPRPRADRRRERDAAVVDRDDGCRRSERGRRRAGRSAVAERDKARSERDRAAIGARAVSGSRAHRDCPGCAHPHPDLAQRPRSADQALPAALAVLLVVVLALLIVLGVALGARARHPFADPLDREQRGGVLAGDARCHRRARPARGRRSRSIAARSRSAPLRRASAISRSAAREGIRRPRLTWAAGSPASSASATSCAARSRWDIQ